MTRENGGSQNRSNSISHRSTLSSAPLGGPDSYGSDPRGLTGARTSDDCGHFLESGLSAPIEDGHHENESYSMYVMEGNETTLFFRIKMALSTSCWSLDVIGYLMADWHTNC